MTAVAWARITSLRSRRRVLAAVLTGLVAFAALGAAGCKPQGSGDGPAVARMGLPAPAYAARSITGDPVSLSDQRGKVVLLNIWATWCHPCRTEIPELEALHERHRDAGLEVVGVSIDAGGDDASVAEFAREYGMTYPLWRDPDGRVSTLFAAVGVPATYLIDRDGVLRWSHVGPVTADDPALTHALAEALGS